MGWVVRGNALLFCFKQIKQEEVTLVTIEIEDEAYPGYWGVYPQEIRRIRNASISYLQKKYPTMHMFHRFVQEKHAQGFCRKSARSIPVQIIAKHRRKEQSLVRGVVNGTSWIFEMPNGVLRPRKRSVALLADESARAA